MRISHTYVHAQEGIPQSWDQRILHLSQACLICTGSQHFETRRRKLVRRTHLVRWHGFLSHDLGERLKIQFRYSPAFWNAKRYFTDQVFYHFTVWEVQTCFLLFSFSCPFFVGNVLAIHPEPRNIALVDVKGPRSTKKTKFFSWIVLGLHSIPPCFLNGCRFFWGANPVFLLRNFQRYSGSLCTLDLGETGLGPFPVLEWRFSATWMSQEVRINA